MSDHFTHFAPDDVAALIKSYPLATICSFDSGFHVSEMPMLLEQDNGAVKSLLGHFPKRNPHFEVLNRNPEALFLFRGPQGYISPSDAEKADWAPTWNFARISIEAKIVFDDALTDQALEAVVKQMEGARDHAWSIDQLGARYHRLREGVIGFRAHINGIRARFKLGQDEEELVFRNIISNMPNTELQSWMTRMRS